MVAVMLKPHAVKMTDRGEEGDIASKHGNVKRNHHYLVQHLLFLSGKYGSYVPFAAGEVSAYVESRDLAPIA